MHKEFYSTTEIAHILRVSRVTVFNRIKKGSLAATKFGRNYLVSHAALLEALGQKIGENKRSNVERAVERAIKEYGETFRLLGKE